MWTKFRTAALVTAFLTGVAPIAFAQTSTTLGAGGSAAGNGSSSTTLGTGGSAAGGGSDTGTSSTLGTGGSTAGNGSSSTTLGTGGSAAGGDRMGTGTSSTLGTGGSTAGSGTSSTLGTGGSAAGSEQGNENMSPSGKMHSRHNSAGEHRRNGGTMNGGSEEQNEQGER